MTHIPGVPWKKGKACLIIIIFFFFFFFLLRFFFVVMEPLLKPLHLKLLSFPSSERLGILGKKEFYLERGMIIF